MEQPSGLKLPNSCWRPRFSISLLANGQQNQKSNQTKVCLKQNKENTVDAYSLHAFDWCVYGNSLLLYSYTVLSMSIQMLSRCPIQTYLFIYVHHLFSRLPTNGTESRTVALSKPHLFWWKGSRSWQDGTCQQKCLIVLWGGEGEQKRWWWRSWRWRWRWWWMCTMMILMPTCWLGCSMYVCKLYNI